MAMFPLSRAAARKILLLCALALALARNTAASASSTFGIVKHRATSKIIHSGSAGRSRRVSTRTYRRAAPAVPDHKSHAGLDFLVTDHENDADITATIPCRSIGSTLLRGALLRIASDMSGGTPLENIKTRVTLTKQNPIEAARGMVSKDGIGALWRGSSSRTIEGGLIGAVFMLGSVATKAQLRRMGAPPTAAALAGGLVGGVAQAAIMTPAGLIFTALNNQSDDKKETTIGIVRRVISEKGIGGMYSGGGAMCLRQATNWASRSGFTEIARSAFHLSDYGTLGEIASGVIGGVGSCWNTPIETIRVTNQRDVSKGLKPKKMGEYWQDIVEESGYPGLFRGITPRAVQAVWQTVFLVVVPNVMGI